MNSVAAPSTPVASRGRVSVRALAEAPFDIRAVLLIAAALIAGTLWWCLHQSYNVLLSYADAPTHLDLARRVQDDLHPGLGQLGAYWLPLAHVIELPFIWNDTLWRTGLAGALPAMGCYLISVAMLYQLARLATGERMPGVIAGLAFAANPNVLYLHVLPMFEPSIIASILVAAYLLARWLQRGTLSLLVATAAAMSVATISRFEAWAFVVGSALVVGVALWQRGHRGERLRGQLLFYLVLAWYAIALWFVWNLALNGDALYFLHPSFNKGLSQDRLAPLTRHHLSRAIAYVFFSIADNAGPALVGLGALGLWRFAVAFGLKARGLWLYLLAAPAAFDVFYLWFRGTPPILVPQLIPKTSGNIRYGVVLMPLLCLLAAYLARRPAIVVRGPAPVARLLVVVRRLMPFTWPFAQVALLAVVLAQPVILVRRHYVVSFNEANTRDYRLQQDVRVATADWLGKHYDRGLILMSTFKGADRIIVSSGLPDRVFVHEGSQNTWHCALARPQRWVRWIVLYRRGDGAVQLTHSLSVGGRKYFTLLQSIGGDGGYWVFRRNGRPWHPAHPEACE